MKILFGFYVVFLFVILLTQALLFAVFAKRNVQQGTDVQSGPTQLNPAVVLSCYGLS